MPRIGYRYVHGIRPMKAFAIRLLLGGSLILLAVVMAGQAQKNRHAKADSGWDLPESDPQELVPIGSPDAYESQPGLTSPADSPAELTEPNPFSPDQGVQLVQHTEPTDSGSGSALPTFAVPDLPGLGAPQPESSSSSPTLTLGDMTLPDFSAKTTNSPPAEAPPSSASISLPNIAGGPQNPAPVPAINMGSPGNALRGAGSLGPMDQPGPSVVGPGPGVIGAPPNAMDMGPGAIDMIGRDPAMPDAPMAGQPMGSPAPMMKALSLPGQTPVQAAPQIAATGHNSEIRLNNSSNMRIVPPAPQENQILANPVTQLPVPNLPPQGAAPPAMQNMAMQNNAAPIQNTFAPMQNNTAPMQNNFPPMQDNTAPMQNVMPAPGGNPLMQGGAPVVNQNPANSSMPQMPVFQNQNPNMGQPIGRMASSRTLPNLPPTAAPGYGPSAASDGTLPSPGDRRFDGAQSPSIVIHKRAPKEVKVGKPAAFAIHVQNVGSVEAMDVKVHDRIPSGMQLLDAMPKPTQVQGDLVMWNLGSMRAGDEQTVTMQLKPMEEGELGSVARVTFEAAASVRTISTRPQLKVTQASEQSFMIGDDVVIEIEISNPGTGSATGVVLQEDVPDGLSHPKGRQLDKPLGTLGPGEKRRQTLRLRAVAPGVIQNTITLKGDDGLEAAHTIALQVVAPKLEVALAGPSKRFLERKATFDLQIQNKGTADATNVEITAFLDRGFKFISTEHEGQYDQSRHAVVWSLADLPSNMTAPVPLTLLPIEEGQAVVKLEAKADLGAMAKSERSVQIGSLAELTFSINDSADPIEVGGETTYEIKVTNTGSRADSNVEVALQLPAGIELISSSDTQAKTDGNGLIAFGRRNQFPANSEMVFRVVARGVQQGTHIVKAMVRSDQSQVPVNKEESTTVYFDR